MCFKLNAFNVLEIRRFKFGTVRVVFVFFLCKEPMLIVYNELELTVSWKIKLRDFNVFVADFSETTNNLPV